MPCRPTLRPVLVEQYLWISDEAVNAAWNRFLRISRTTHRHDKSDRRYGSNVPGPLEAHRRQARRRMGISAVGAGLPGGGADVGALFGFGGYGGRQFDPRRDLKWKPPGVEKVKKEEHWMFPKSAKRKVDTFDTFLAREEDGDAVEVSRATFDALLDQKDVVDIMPADLEDVFAFLQSAKDEPEANNTLRLCEWMAKRPHSLQAYRALARLIIDKIHLRTLDGQDMSQIMAVSMAFEKKSPTAILSILDAMPHDMVQDIACNVIRTMYQKSASDYEPSDEILEWLLYLRRSSSFRSGNFMGTWRRVHQVLASCFSNPAMLIGHLRRFNEANLCEILLEHWVPRIRPLKDAEVTILRAPNVKVYRFRANEPTVDAIRATYTALRSMKSASVRGNMRHWTCTINLLAALQKHNVPTRSIALAAFAILARGQRARTTFSIFRQLQAHLTVGVPWVLPTRLVRHFLESRSPVALAYARRVFLSCPWVPLSTCYDLPVRLARAGKSGATALWAMLRRQTPEDHVRRRDRSDRTNRLRIEHARLIHQVAWEIANCAETRPRVAFRRVWECTRFLKDRKAYIHPMMTSAMVTAGIMRYLQAYRRPAVAQVRYILSIVSKVEGQEVAEKLDRVVWTLWKEKVLPEIKSRWRDHVIRVRQGLEEVVEEVSGGRRFNLGPKWRKRAGYRPRGTKDHRIAAARQTWVGSMEKLVNTPAVTADLSSTDAERQSLDTTPSSTISVAPPSPDEVPPIHIIFRASSTTSVTSLQRTGLGYDHRDLIPAKSQRSENHQTDIRQEATTTASAPYHKPLQRV